MLDYIFLGILQGLFEWIPLSSEGVVALTSQFLVLKDNPIDIALSLHLGTFLAVVFYFRNDWFKILKFKNQKLTHFLLISTFVSLVIGFPLYQAIKNMVIGSWLLMLIACGLLLTAYFHNKKIKIGLKLENLAVPVGFLQGMSVIPGLSRSGSTIFGLSLGDLKPDEILKISYLMSAPVVLASGIYLFINNPVFVLNTWPGLTSSFLVGTLTLDFLIKWSQKINFFNFALIFSILCFLGAILELFA